MTIAEQIEQRGMEKGRKQGLKQGKIIVLTELLTNLLQEKFGDVSAKYLVHIQQAELETLLRWSKKILEAQTLNEIFQE